MPEIPKPRDYYYYSPYIHPSVMFRAELFDENLGYPASEETFRCEDYEIFMNLTKRGQKGYNLKETLFCYRETRDSYRKRKVRFRLNEAKIRYRNFKKMGILFPLGWLYVLRPIAACLIPTKALELIKRYEGGSLKRMEESDRRNRPMDKQLIEPEVGSLEGAGRISKKAGVLQGRLEGESLAYAGSRHMHETAGL